MFEGLLNAITTSAKLALPTEPAPMVRSLFAIALAAGIAAAQEPPGRVQPPPKAPEKSKATPTQNLGVKPKPEDILARNVSLVARAVPLRDALASVARLADVELQI